SALHTLSLHDALPISFAADASAAAAEALAIATLNAGSGTGLGHGSPRSIASSPGVLIGGLSDGIRPPKSSNMVSLGRFFTSPKRSEEHTSELQSQSNL